MAVRGGSGGVQVTGAGAQGLVVGYGQAGRVDRLGGRA